MRTNRDVVASGSLSCLPAPRDRPADKVTLAAKERPRVSGSLGATRCIAGSRVSPTHIRGVVRRTSTWRVQSAPRGGSAVVGVALVLLVFKVAGLYERDDLELVHSTLDDLPLLVQLTGLFALASRSSRIPFSRERSAHQIAALWIASLGAIVGAARSSNGGLQLPAGRCFVIGDYEPPDGSATSSPQAELERRSSRRCRSKPDIASPEPSRTPRLSVGFERLNVHRIIIAPTTTDTGVVDLIRIAKSVGVE